MASSSFARRLGAVAVSAVLGAGLLLMTPGTAAAAVPITFELTGTFGDGVQVSYFGPNDEPEVVVAGLPWSTSYDYGGSARFLTFTGIHPGGDPGSVTCRVSIGGRTIVSHTNNAPQAAGVGAYCNVVDLGSGYRGN
ncbi:MmpS family transport accessory protein [Mycolicibacterium sp. 050158]|uniref:MmpS family transport accessory protein n=1 Tax=Mycolicibacterium sp. 050158 TaxID=3090602 RepID=UPI00299CD5F8|nr:MmpS family transport accessory protein [Mycolicibacterium sp. 050158]MDX1889684.1 MmpS family transport accessory protein [Mycolicibacterium sp. 050158]